MKINFFQDDPKHIRLYFDEADKLGVEAVRVRRRILAVRLALTAYSLKA